MIGTTAASIRSTHLTLLLSLGVASLSIMEAVHATPINRGAFVGTNVTYVDVTESSATDPGQVTAGPLGGLFGEPTVSGDALDFNPKNFSASASGAAGNDITDSNLQFAVHAKPGKGISSLGFSERGDATVAGLSNDAFASVSATIFVEVTELNGIPTSIDLPVISMAFTPSDGTYQLSVDGTGPSTTFAFSGAAFIDIGPYIPFGTTATKLYISLDNTLTASSQAGTSAFIQKKDFGGVSITVDTFNIPEPATVSIVLLALVMSGVTRRVQ